MTWLIAFFTSIFAYFGFWHSQLSTQHIDYEVPEFKLESDFGVALVLGGGGARAIYQLGAIQALEEHNIPIDLIVSVSAGSIVGAFYADSGNVGSVLKKADEGHVFDLLDPDMGGVFGFFTHAEGFTEGRKLSQYIKKELKAKTFEELLIPLIVVAHDLETNEIVPISSGEITPAVRASCAIPPFIPPLKWGSRTLADGGIVSPVPVPTALEVNPKMTIAISITPGPNTGDVKDMPDLLYRISYASFFELAKMQTQLADIYLLPNTSYFGTFDGSASEKLIVMGYEAMTEKISEILELMEQRGIAPRAPSGG